MSLSEWTKAFVTSNMIQSNIFVRTTIDQVKLCFMILTTAMSSSVPNVAIRAICYKGYKNKAGLSIHQRATHAAQYHAEHQAESKESEWCDEEKSRII